MALHHSLQRLRATGAAIAGKAGDAVRWQLNFNLGLNGVQARFAGCDLMARMLTDWSLVVLPDTMGLKGTTMLWSEVHAASLLFQMDSAIETLVYAANAVGNAIDISAFRDVSNPAELRHIGPLDVLEPKRASKAKGKGRPTGHERHFPTFTARVRKDAKLVKAIQVQHDVTKHRHAGLAGGRLRPNPPKDFLDHFGITPGDNGALLNVAPMDQVLLSHDPKAPWAGKMPGQGDPESDLLYLAKAFRPFLRDAASTLADDVDGAARTRGWLP